MKYYKHPLFILTLGFAFLIAITLLGTSIDTLIPRRPSSPVQTQQTESYQITLRVSPNPPLLTGPAELSLQIIQRDSQQLVTNAQTIIHATMESMEMYTAPVEAMRQSNGNYLAHFQFTMSGAWQLAITITTPGEPDQQVLFEVTAQ